MFTLPIPDTRPDLRSRPRVGIAVLLLCFLGTAAPVAAETDELHRKQAELERLNQELVEMKRTLEQFRRLKERSQYHQRNVCGKPYRAARRELTVIEQRAQIQGFDRIRADAKNRYRANRQAMIECINRSLQNDSQLRARGIGSYAALKHLYDSRKASAREILPQYKAKRRQARRLQQEIQRLQFGLPEIPAETDTTTRGGDCGPHGKPFWRGNKQGCDCDAGYWSPTPGFQPMGCFREGGHAPVAQPKGGPPGGVFGQPDDR